MRASCIRHQDRFSEQHECSASIRDRKNPARNVCCCCEDCKAECLSHPPHNHGGSIEDEWDRSAKTSSGIQCKVCGMEIL